MQILVERLLAAGFGSLDVLVFSLETFGSTLQGQGLFDEVLLAILLGDAVAEELGGTLNDSSNLRVLRWVGLAVILLVVSVRVKHGTHADELKVSLQLGSHFCLGEVEPLRPSIWLFLIGIRCQRLNQTLHIKKIKL